MVWWRGLERTAHLRAMSSPGLRVVRLAPSSRPSTTSGLSEILNLIFSQNWNSCQGCVDNLLQRMYNNGISKQAKENKAICRLFISNITFSFSTNIAVTRDNEEGIIMTYSRRLSSIDPRLPCPVWDHSSLDMRGTFDHLPSPEWSGTLCWRYFHPLQSVIYHKYSQSWDKLSIKRKSFTKWFLCWPRGY